MKCAKAHLVGPQKALALYQGFPLVRTTNKYERRRTTTNRNCFQVRRKYERRRTAANEIFDFGEIFLAKYVTANRGEPRRTSTNGGERKFLFLDFFVL